MSAGNPLGAAMPRQPPMVQLLPVRLFNVGTWGYSAAGALAMITIGRALPASISGRASGSDAATMSTPPAARSTSAGAGPLDGTQRTATVSSFRSLSMPARLRCQMPPWPVPEALRLPGAAFTAFGRLFKGFLGDLEINFN